MAGDNALAIVYWYLLRKNKTEKNDCEERNN